MAETLTHDEWLTEAKRRFGDDPMDWRFVCPSCGHIASVKDWKDAGAAEGEVAFSCVGRHLGADSSKTFKKEGGPCNYAGGGLFKLNPVSVEHVGKRIPFSLSQINREKAVMAECYHCGKPILAGEPSCSVNIAPHAASGGVMKPHHSACAPFVMQMVPNPNRPPAKNAPSGVKSTE